MLVQAPIEINPNKNLQVYTPHVCILFMEKRDKALESLHEFLNKHISQDYKSLSINIEN